MVNVAGRSKGCLPCRQRKVKCDLSLPQCQRCVDLRITCPGPRVGAFFVHCSQQQQQQQAQQQQQQDLSAALTRIPPPATSCRAAAWDQLFLAHFVDSFGLPGGATLGGPPTWLETLPAFLHAGGALATASIRSAAMLSYGTWARDDAVRADSYRWYAAALAQLGRSIRIRDDARRRQAPLPTALCAAVMLIHFETWAGTAPNAWAQHVRGAAALLRAAGPEAVARGGGGGFVRAVFSHLRFQVFIASMQDGTLHVFARPPWLEVPFREQRGTLFDELVDALFAVQRCLFTIQQQAEALHSFSNISDISKVVGSLVDQAAGHLSAWNEKYMHFLRPAPCASDTRGDELIVKFSSKVGPSLPEAALLSLFHAGRLIISQLACATGVADVPDTAAEDAHVILEAANSGAHGHSPPSSKLRPFMLLPGLKIASIWSPSTGMRVEARALLLDEQILASPMADIALTSEGYFSRLASSVLETIESRNE